MTPKQLVKYYGSIQAAAYNLGYCENAVRYWIKKNRIPKHAEKWAKSQIALSDKKAA